jgi:type IV fimbrial biogenesis protein FimT
MLTPFNKMRGFTLIELLVAVAIFGILIAMGSRSFASWIQNQQIRTGAESILNGMQLARGEAVKRNASAMFVLCDLAAGKTGSSWDVLAASAAAVAQACAPDAGAATGWERVQQRSGQEGSRNAAVATTGAPAPNAVAFNGFGRVVTLATVPLSANTIVQPIAQVDVSNQKLGNCESDATPGPARCLSITVGAGGNLRMCDPSPNLAATDSRHC